MGRRPAAPTGAAPACPCGPGPSYPLCCGRLHRGEVQAESAERLMRARFGAFAVGDRAYLLRTWHPASRPPELQLDRDRHWTGLQVLGATDGGLLHTEGTVEFRASYTAHGVAGVLHERSTFARVAGLWVYVGPC